ncbi:MAG: hypothetical protein AAGC64_00060 [Bacteroidota bacterium]
MLGEKEQLKAIVKLSSRPKLPDKPNEISKWKRFLNYINPWAKKLNKAADITQAYYEGEAFKRHNEGKKFAAEAAEIASRIKVSNQEKVKLVNDEIERIFTNDGLPYEAKMLQLANLVANNPEIAEQLQKVKDMSEVLRTVNFTNINFGLEEKQNSTISNTGLLPTELKQEEDNVVHEVPLAQMTPEQMELTKSILVTKISNMNIDLSILKALHSNQIDTLGDLVCFRKQDLLKFEGLTVEIVEGLEKRIEEYGLKYGMDLFPYGFDKE